MKGRVILAGGSGFIGSFLKRHLESEGYECWTLTRKPQQDRDIEWDARSVGAWARSLEDSAAVVNLTGANIAKRWTPEYKREIVNSRVDSTQVIGKAIANLATPPKVWINGSGVGFYGDSGESAVDESSPGGDDFVADLCAKWEGAVYEHDTPATRRVIIRTGNVLGGEGGMFRTLLTLSKWFLGSPIGSGRQWTSWIHQYDYARLIRWVIEHPHSGPINGTAPNPARNAELMAAIRRAVGRPWAPPVPKFMLSLINYFGGPDPSLPLVSLRVLPRAALEAGFEFRFPELEPAVRDLVATRG